MKTLCALWFLITLPAAALAQTPCSRTDAFSLSDTAAAVLSEIETNTGAEADSPVDLQRILSTCNRFLSVEVDGPNIFAAARDLIATAQHEVDMVFFGWEHDSDASRLIGDGLIASQAGRRRGAPLLVRIIVDDVTLNLSRAVNELYDSEKSWVARGLDTTRVQLQFATSPRSTGISPNLHDKIIVVDGRYALITGANVQKHNDAGQPWHDSAYLFEGDVALSALEDFEDSWKDKETNFWRCRPQRLSLDCDKRPPFPEPKRPWLDPFGSQQPGDVPILAVGRKKDDILFNNADNPQDIAWTKVMDLATSHIHVESPNINDDGFQAAVKRAVCRGVQVELISSLGFNEMYTDAPSLGGSNLEVVGNLRKGIRRDCPQYQDRFRVRWYSANGREPVEDNDVLASHTKYMSADDRVAVVGSGNQDTISWNISHELNVLVDDPGVTRQVESAVFLPDWERSIGSYAELYEGYDGTQDIVCPITTAHDKVVFFNDQPFPSLFDTWRCNNDEAKSILLHDVGAGRVLLFYDDPWFQYQDDDWVEIVTKRPIVRKYIGTFERTFEDDDVRMTYHWDNGLDGKISAARVSGSPVGPVIDLYEGNNGSQSLVCSNQISGYRTIEMKKDAHCENDEARSMVLSNVPADRAIFLYDDPGGSRGDDWAVIVPRRTITHALVGSFEHSLRTADYELCAFPRNGLDGKVSRMRVGPASEAAGLCGGVESVLSTSLAYTLSPAPSTRYPDPGGELTDGVTATGESWINAAGWLYTDPTITLDLGASFDLTQVDLYVGDSFGDGSFGVFRPARATVSLSTDGVLFTPVGDLSFSEWSAVGTKEQVDLGTLPLDRHGRFVRLTITAGGPWVMATELVVKGFAAGACPGLGRPCDGPDADLCREGTLLSDCSCSDTTGDLVELCNGLDDDCDGLVDEGNVCGGPISSGGEYLVSPPPATQYPDAGGELTDGITETGVSWIDAAGWLYTDPTITLDLGTDFDLAAMELYVGNSFGDGSFGVARPARATVSTSSDGMTFTPVGDLSFGEWSAVGTKEQVDLGTATLGTRGRYVRLEITSGGAWVMVTEVAVLGSP